MTRTLALVPVRGARSAKTRLSPLFAHEQRLQLVWAMLRRMLVLLEQSAAIEHTVVVARDSSILDPRLERAGAWSALMQDNPDGGLNGALEDGRAWAIAHGFDRLLMLPGDLPILDKQSLRMLTETSGEVVIVSDDDGTGTNALRLDMRDDRVAEGFTFRMGSDSFAAHFTEATAVGIVPIVLSLPRVSHDLDTPADWHALSEVVRADLLQAVAAADPKSITSYGDHS